jgi:cytolysin (calcineurin-like family phosphatase)
VHCVQLNISAGGEWHPYNPHHSLEFLTNDLALSVGDSGRPVLLFQHISIKLHGAIDITGEAKTNFFNAIQPYNIVGLFHGHVHDSGYYTWRGIDVFNTTHMHRETDEHPPRHGFLVVQIMTNRMRVAEYKSDGTWGYTFSKPLKLKKKNN